MTKKWTYTKNEDGFMGSENRVEEKNIEVYVRDGMVIDVKNLPDDWTLEVIDYDNEPERS